jgi:molecular chaperone GrpE (heat shock protein)
LPARATGWLLLRNGRRTPFALNRRCGGGLGSLGQVADLKANVETQFRASIDILDIAKELNGIRRRLDQEGRVTDAEALKQAIIRLIDQSDKLTESARSNGRAVVDTLRESW